MCQKEWYPPWCCSGRFLQAAATLKCTLANGGQALGSIRSRSGRCMKMPAANGGHRAGQGDCCQFFAALKCTGANVLQACAAAQVDFFQAVAFTKYTVANGGQIRAAAQVDRGQTVAAIKCTFANGLQCLGQDNFCQGAAIFNASSSMLVNSVQPLRSMPGVSSVI